MGSDGTKSLRGLMPFSFINFKILEIIDVVFMVFNISWGKIRYSNRKGASQNK